MNTKQRIYLQADLWPKACEGQGWNPSDRAKRLEVIGKILGRGIKSTNEICTDAEFDAVKRELGFLADSVKATIETIHPEEGRARRLREKIREHVKMLGVYHPKPQAYLNVIVLDKFSKLGWGASIDELTAKPTFRTGPDGRLIEGPSQLEQILMAMARGVQMRRKKAGDSIHDMLWKAKLPCGCAACIKRRLVEQAQDAISEEIMYQEPDPEYVQTEGEAF